MALLRALDLRPPASWAARTSGGVKPGPTRRAAESEAATAVPLATAKAAGARSGGKVKVGAQMEIGTRQFTPFKTKYGDLQITATVKTTGALVLASGGDLDVGINVTSKDKKDGRATGTKKSIGWKGFDERTLFDGFDLKDLSLAAEFEISGTDVTVACAFSFVVVTHSFAAPAQAKLVILSIKGGDQVKGPGIEIKVAPAPFRLKIGGVDASVVAEVKASFLVDIKKVGAEIGKKIVVRAGVKMLEREAAKQGVKVLSGPVARAVLKDLGPLAAAFGVGWDIGEVLNAYTVAPQAAGMVYDDILGDLNERYRQAGTLGKMWLISRNSPKIVGAMIAAGVTGAVAGIGDLVLFKLMGLDKLGDYAESFADFGRDITAGMRAVRDAIEAGVGGTLLYGAIMIGVKSNPAHHIVAHAALEPIMAAIFAKLAPMYRQSDGYSKTIGLTVGGAQPPAAALLKFARHVLAFKMNTSSWVDLGNEAAATESLRGLSLPVFLIFLQENHLIRYTVQTDGNMDPDDIDPRLLDELFG